MIVGDKEICFLSKAFRDISAKYTRINLIMPDDVGVGSQSERR